MSGAPQRQQLTSERTPLYCNVLSKIMFKSHKPELNLDFSVGLQFATPQVWAAVSSGARAHPRAR